MKPLRPGEFVVTIRDRIDYGHVMRTFDGDEADAALKLAQSSGHEEATLWITDKAGVAHAMKPGGKR